MPADESFSINEGGGDAPNPRQFDDAMDDDGSNMDFQLEGYGDLDENNSCNDEDDEGGTRDTLQTRPAFFSRTTKAAERAAMRTEANAADSFLLVENDEEDYEQGSSSRTPGTFGRTDKGLPAYSKKVSANLCADDQLMMDMRDQGFTDGQIADRLFKEGRVRYDRKSIGTRITRIRLAQAAHVDHLLEEGYKEWEHEDDLRLMQAYEFANIEVEYEIERIRAWRFKKVSEYMRRLDKDSIFSEKACRERFQGLMAGTAKIPIDLDDDPDARRAEMEAFRQERENKRAIEREQKEKEEAMKLQIKEEARLRNLLKAEESARRREQQYDEKAQRAMKRAADNQLKLDRAKQHKEAKIQELEELRQKKAAEKAAEEKKLREGNKNTPMKLAFVTELKTVTQDTPDPRASLSFENLQNLCKERSLDPKGVTKEELVQRLRDADNARKIVEVRNVCRSKGLNTTATKVQLLYQLATLEAQKYQGNDVEMG